MSNRQLTPDIKGSCPYCQEEQVINYEHRIYGLSHLAEQVLNCNQEQQCKSCNKIFDWEVSLLGFGSVKTFKQQGE